LITPSEPIGVNVLVIEPGLFRLNETPLLNSSSTEAVPVPVVLPEKLKNASLRSDPETL
jgi:hypothetical protein